MSDMEEDEDYGFEYETDDDEEQDVDIENQVSLLPSFQLFVSYKMPLSSAKTTSTQLSRFKDPCNSGVS